MGRPCKCRYCQTSITTDIAHLEYIKGKKAYFCNEEHYAEFIEAAEAEVKKKEQSEQLRDKFYTLMCEILGVTGITNTALWKEKAEINKVFSDKVIVAYLDENKSWITTSVNKLSGGIYGKIRYVSVILRNKLGDYKPKVVVREVEKPKVVVDVVQEVDTRDDIGLRINKKKKNIRRRGFSEMED